MNPSSPPPSSYQHQQQQQRQRTAASPYHQHAQHPHHLPPPPQHQQHSPAEGYLPHPMQHHQMDGHGGAYHHGHIDHHEAWRREQHQQHRMMEQRERDREREHYEAQHGPIAVHYRHDGYDGYPHHAHPHAPPHHQAPSPPGRGHSRTQSRDAFLPPPLPPTLSDRQSPAMRFEPLKQRRSPPSAAATAEYGGRDPRESQHKRKRSAAYDQYAPWEHHQTYPPGYDYRAAEEEYYYQQHQQQQAAAAAAAQQQRHAQRERDRERDDVRPSAPPVQKAHRRTASVEQQKARNKQVPPPVSPSVAVPPPPHHMASPYDAPHMLPGPPGRPTHEEMAMYEHGHLYGQHPPPPPPIVATNGTRHHDGRREPARRVEHPSAPQHEMHPPAVNGNGAYDDRHHRAPSTAAAAAAAAMPPPPPPAHAHPAEMAAHHPHHPHGLVSDPTPAAPLHPPGPGHPAHHGPPHHPHHVHPHHHQQQQMGPPIHQLQRHRVISDGVWHWLEENAAASKEGDASSDGAAPSSGPHLAGSFVYEPFVSPLLPAELIVRNVGALLEVRIPGKLLGAYREKSDSRAGAGWTLGWRARQHGCRVDLPTDSGREVKEVQSTARTMPFWSHRGLAERKVWGSEVYTDDSDVLGMCVHAGWIEGPTRLPSSSPQGELGAPNGHSTNDATPLYSPPDIRVVLRVAPRLVGYRESYAGGLWSRNWLGMHDGLSLVVEEVALESAGWADKARLPGPRGLKSEAGRLGLEGKRIEALEGLREGEEENEGSVQPVKEKVIVGGARSLTSLLTGKTTSLKKTVFPLSEVRSMGKAGESASSQDSRAWYRLNQVVSTRG